MGAAAVGKGAAAAPSALSSADAIANLFAGLPGTLAFRIVAPATARTRRLDISSDPARQLFVASSVKVFIAVEALRQEDSPDVSATMDQRQLPLDATVCDPPARLPATRSPARSEVVDGELGLPFAGDAGVPHPPRLGHVELGGPVHQPAVVPDDHVTD